MRFREENHHFSRAYKSCTLYLNSYKQSALSIYLISLSPCFYPYRSVSKQIIALPFYLPLQGCNLGIKINGTSDNISNYDSMPIKGISRLLFAEYKYSATIGGETPNMPLTGLPTFCACKQIIKQDL
jgi:hypothetical protein